MLYITFNVYKQKIKRTDTQQIVSDSRNYLKASFSFSDDDWIGIKTAIFKNGDVVRHAVLDDNNECLVPWEVIKSGILHVSVFCGDLITADTATVYINESGYEDGGTPEDPSPTVYEQIIAMLNEIETGGIPDDKISAAVQAYLEAHPVETLTEEDVQRIVTEYVEAHKDELKGEKGDTGNTPNLTIGTVETLPSGSDATATITGDKENPVLNLGIPKGADGQGNGTSNSTVDVLEGKKIAFVGDSITYGTGSVVVKDIRCDGYYNPYSPKISYPEIIKELHPNALVYNYAQAGLAIGENTSGSNLIAILDSLVSAVSDVDYLVLSGGVNDSWVSGTTLGSLSDSYGGNYDKTTFYGALEQYIYNAINAYPDAYIMFLMTHNDIKKDYGSGVVNMNDVIRKVCEKWKIKLLDLNKNIGVNLSISPYKDKYMSDSTHPNEQCYRKFYAPLCNEEILSYGIDTSVSSGTGDGGSGDDDNVTIMGITATKTKTVYVVGEIYSDSDITVTANYSDGTTVDVTSDSTINSSDVNTSEEGTYIVNVEYSVDGVSYADSITITVSNSQGSAWDDSVVLSGTWSNATFANTTVSQISGTNRVTGTIMSDKTIKSVSLKLVSEFAVVDLAANEPYTIDVEFTGNMNYTGNIVATAKGSGDYPVTLYIKDFAIS